MQELSIELRPMVELDSEWWSFSPCLAQSTCL